MRSYLSDTYSKARHYLSSFDTYAGLGKAVYRTGAPLLAYGLDSYGVSDETKTKAYIVKQALDSTGKQCNRLRKTARVIDQVANHVI